jgi:hypothetical protein
MSNQQGTQYLSRDIYLAIATTRSNSQIVLCAAFDRKTLEEAARRIFQKEQGYWSNYNTTRTQLAVMVPESIHLTPCLAVDPEEDPQSARVIMVPFYRQP